MASSAMPVESMKSVSLRSTSTTRPGSANSVSKCDNRDAVAMSSSPTTDTTARPSCTSAFTSKGVGNAMPSRRVSSARISGVDQSRIPASVSYRTEGVAGSDKPVEHLSQDPITPTRRALEPTAIGAGAPAPAEPDEAGLLQDAGHNRHGRAANAQHLGQELLGEGELV